MDDKTIQALTALAEKLGTTAQYLWGVLVRQAPISGAVDLGIVALFLAATVALFVFVRRAADDPSLDEEVLILGWALVILACIATSIIVLSYVPYALYAIFNPEYWALRQIWK